MKKLMITLATFLFLSAIVLGIILIRENRIRESALATQEKNGVIENEAIAKENNEPNPDEEELDKPSVENDMISPNEGDNSQNDNIDIGKEPISEPGEAMYNFDKNQVVRLKNQDAIVTMVNKLNDLAPEYIPSDLVEPNVRFSFDGKDEKRQMREEAAKALEELFKGAESDEINLFAVSGYRSYNRQKYLFDNYVKTMGEEAAKKVSAQPGQSEHQTGLAMDVSCQAAGFNLVDSMGEMPEGIWLKENSHKYGFTVRYAADKTEITGYSYEPWHIRYIGTEIASYLYENNITLEEFYEKEIR